MEQERYRRQMLLPGWGEAQQAKLREASVLVAGVGGVGGAAAQYLAAAGVGRLVLLHQGPLTLSNLNRQTLMREAELGRPRVATALKTLRAFNAGLALEAHDQPVSQALLKRLLPGVHLVLDARHNFPERRLLNQMAVAGGKPMVEAAMNGMEGYLYNILPGRTPCLACLTPQDPPAWDPMGFPVVGAVAGTVGCLQALEAIKLLAGFGQPLHSQMLHLNFNTLRFRQLKTFRNPDCPVCGPLPQAAITPPKTYHTALRPSPEARP